MPNVNPEKVNQQGAKINDTTLSNHNSFSHFDLNEQRLQTLRFGEYTPFFFKRSIGSDNLEFASKHNLRAYTFSSPLMSSLTMYKEIFNVPMATLMPNTWSKYYAIPLKGDDVPLNTSLGLDLNRMHLWYNSLLGYADVMVDDESQYTEYLDYLIAQLKAYVTWYNTFSDGGLLALCGIHPSMYYGVDGCYLVETLHNRVIAYIKEMTEAVIEDPEVIDTNKTLQYIFKIFFDGCEAPRDYFVRLIDIATGVKVFDSIALASEHWNDAMLVDTSLVAQWVTKLSSFFTDLVPVTTLDKFVNLSKPLAYQLVCSEYFTKDNIDAVYTSELFLQNATSLEQMIWQHRNVVRPFFDFNGIHVYYDAYSYENTCLLLNTNNLSIYSIAVISDYFNNLLSFNRSLKYADYFNGAKARPLAVGNINAPVTAQGVNAIDNVQSLLWARFLHKVNQFGSRLGDYVRGLLGIKSDSLPPMPKFIAKERFSIYGEEVTNTAENQGTVELNLKDADSRRMFNFNNNSEESIIVGICYFDIVQSYTSTSERDMFFRTREDSFIPNLQNLGDQKVEARELSTVYINDSYNDFLPVSYQNRYSEWKQAFSQAFGGFCLPGQLPSWAYTTKYNPETLNFIDSNFIRHTPTDIDDFYKSLTGSGYCDYFHFVASFVNVLGANRPMFYKSNILF